MSRFMYSSILGRELIPGLLTFKRVEGMNVVVEGGRGRSWPCSQSVDLSVSPASISVLRKAGRTLQDPLASYESNTHAHRDYDASGSVNGTLGLYNLA